MQHLKYQLDNYDLRLDNRRKTGRSHQELMAYSAAAVGAAVAAPEAAMGAVVHVTTPVTFNGTSGIGTYSSGLAFRWDVDGTGGYDFMFAWWAKTTATNRVGASYVYSNVDKVVGNGGLALALSAGFSVGPTLASGVFGVLYGLMSNNGANGNFASTTAYMGFQFPGDTGTPGTQYGWAKVRVNNVSATQVQLKILEWAYDDSGAAISVGDTGGGGASPVSASLPENLAPLTLLGLGAAGLAAFRRRRDKVPAEREIN
jgi:hypothetical protein